MSAELLREAAAKMREQGGHPGDRWRARLYGGMWQVVSAVPEDGLVAVTGDEDVDHIASWDPIVAEAVADWLDDEATDVERHIASWQEGSKDPRNRWAERGMTVESTIEHHYGRALAVARAYLRRQP